MKLHLQPATRADLPLLSQLYAEMDGQPPLDEATLHAVFSAIEAIPHYQIYLVYLADQLVGTFSLLMAPTMMHRGMHQFAVLDAVTVSPSYRNQGIGKAMLQEALQLSQAAGCYKMMLSSNVKRDRAHAFYESLGFEQHGWSFHLVLPAK
ncbi:GNAT family N-acetyltransferase [Oculatella sp. LEGE 06141]|uniref:GNAT family N-acetyltransferase n=1 Tax=Oculatella sp. LEGE 06141 TaxID=1828648 RepID=UPI00187DE8D2|nr:GNAT family N-acetyltransferase [Oculatella sp. LEGE 06141]MBE9182798.1 GNAT family N-acetyltransferase [Oculatella sp. LEGE 06141]